MTLLNPDLSRHKHRKHGLYQIKVKLGCAAAINSNQVKRKPKKFIVLIAVGPVDKVPLQPMSRISSDVVMMRMRAE